MRASGTDNQAARRMRAAAMDKAEAEKMYGFHLYQGGVVPGNELRVVNIEGVDTEACCGTHCDSTAEVGWIKLVKTHTDDNISDIFTKALDKAAFTRHRDKLVAKD